MLLADLVGLIFLCCNQILQPKQDFRQKYWHPHRLHVWLSGLHGSTTDPTGQIWIQCWSPTHEPTHERCSVAHEAIKPWTYRVQHYPDLQRCGTHRASTQKTSISRGDQLLNSHEIIKSCDSSWLSKCNWTEWLKLWSFMKRVVLWWVVMLKKKKSTVLRLLLLFRPQSTMWCCSHGTWGLELCLGEEVWHHGHAALLLSIHWQNMNQL